MSIIKSRAGRVARAQMKKLLDLLSEDGVLELGKVMYIGTNRKNFWKRIALQLNNVNGGVHKNPLQWCKMWADWKNKTKTKANVFLRRNKSKTDHITFNMTDLELRLLKIIKYPFDNATDILKLETLLDKPDDTANTVNELHTLDFISGDFIESGDEKISSNGEETEYCNDNIESHFCSVDDVLQDNNETGECSSGTDRKEKVKLKGKSYKRKKISLEEYKIKTTLVLEKEKVQQKTEELKLKALELKVKNDELKLKEMEMNKINYLTNIEEEKLKCLRDISLCLKELLERNKSGTFRFSNML